VRDRVDGGSRAAREDELDAIAEVIGAAFLTDPVWGPALEGRAGGVDHLLPYWRLFVDGAQRFGTVRVLPGLEAVAVWLPPGAEELDASGVDSLVSVVESSMEAEVVADLFALYERFEASRAPLPEHAYLSLLATHPERRGRGLGQQLLASDLALWDEAGIPAYLESTNPVNDHRYARAGFQPIGGFDAVRNGAPVTAMWRRVGGAADPIRFVTTVGR
jgi:GNAT superfamily N-acetyltransferase